MTSLTAGAAGQRTAAARFAIFNRRHGCWQMAPRAEEVRDPARPLERLAEGDQADHHRHPDEGAGHPPHQRPAEDRDHHHQRRDGQRPTLEAGVDVVADGELDRAHAGQHQDRGLDVEGAARRWHGQLPRLVLEAWPPTAGSV
jgi:hypothetical protein